MIILGSTSPRRKELLSLITKDFITIKPSFDEKKVDLKTPNYALNEAYNKSLSLRNNLNKNDILITSDTIVILNDVIFGKPKDEKDAFRMLKELSNKTHKVISGYVIYSKKIEVKKEITTYVTFNNLSDKEIKNYIKSVMVLDKAGAYAIQDDAKFHLINNIKGSYYNVMGFPLEDIKIELKKFI